MSPQLGSTIRVAMGYCFFNLGRKDAAMKAMDRALQVRVFIQFSVAIQCGDSYICTLRNEHLHRNVVTVYSYAV